MTASPDIKRAARLAAERIEAMLITMLERGEVGHVAVVVDAGGLEPVKTVATKGKRIGVARGSMTAIERVG